MTHELPSNIESIEDVRLMGLAGSVFLGESNEVPTVEFNDGVSNFIFVYADDSMKLDANEIKLYPSFQDYLLECDESTDDRVTAQLRLWADL